MTLLNMMIRTGRLSEFISEVVTMHNEEVEEQTLWECWLHKNFEQSFAGYRETIRLNSAQETGKEDLFPFGGVSVLVQGRFRSGNVVRHSKAIQIPMEHFKAVSLRAADGNPVHERAESRTSSRSIYGYFRGER